MGVLAVFILPLIVVGVSGVIYIYRAIVQLMSTSAVRSKVVVIADALSGLGKECSRVFHVGGARLVLCGKNLDKLEELYDALNSVADPRATFTPKLLLLDLSDVNCIQDVAKEILDCYGCVDILINNASTKVKGTVQNISLEVDRKVMDANYFGPITLTKALIPNMVSRRTGQIILVNNIQGKLGVPFRGAFLLRKLAYGVHPTELAEEILRTVTRKKQEVFVANPVAKAAVYIRTFFPELFFAVVAAGVKEKLKIGNEK